MCNNSLAYIISLINVYNHLHSEVSQICFEGGVAKILYIPYKQILIGGVANQNNFATPNYAAKVTCQNKFATLPHDYPSLWIFFDFLALLEEKHYNIKISRGNMNKTS